METFVLGPLQREWIKSLREHPERQESEQLGSGNLNDYTACCLGELLVCAHRVLPNFPSPFKNGHIVDSDSKAYLSFSFERFGLFNSTGSIDNGSIGGYFTLAYANDHGVTWPEIADFIESNPEKVFTHSV